MRAAVQVSSAGALLSASNREGPLNQKLADPVNDDEQQPVAADLRSGGPEPAVAQLEISEEGLDIRRFYHRQNARSR